MADDRLLEETLTAWRANERINKMLIDAIPREGMTVTLSKRGGRNVVRQLAHLHNVRVYQLSKRARPIAEGLRVFESKEEPSKKDLRAAFAASSKRVEEWFRRGLAGEKGFKLMKGGVVPTLAYLVAHESHHRGSILLTLKQCGHGLGIDVTYGIWGEWNKA